MITFYKTLLAATVKTMTVDRILVRSDTLSNPKRMTLMHA